MARVKKNPKDTADGQQPEDDLADLNDPDTDFEPEDDTEIDRQEESDSNVEMSEVDMIHQAFIWIGFNKKYDQESLRSEIAELQDINGLTEGDISDLKKSYTKRPGKIGGVFFGLQHTKKIKFLMQWVQDFTRVDKVPTFNDMEKESFTRAIAVAAQRDLIWDKESKDVSVVSAEASPNKFKD